MKYALLLGVLCTSVLALQVHERLAALPHAWAYFPALFLVSLGTPVALLLTPLLMGAFCRTLDERRPVEQRLPQVAPVVALWTSLLVGVVGLLSQVAGLWLLSGHPLDVMRFFVVVEGVLFWSWGGMIAGVQYTDLQARRWGSAEMVNGYLKQGGRRLLGLGVALSAYGLLGGPAAAQVGLAPSSSWVSS